jgi:hypothetical protein
MGELVRTARTATSTTVSAEERPSALATAFDRLEVSSVVVLPGTIFRQSLQGQGLTVMIALCVTILRRGLHGKKGPCLQFGKDAVEGGTSTTCRGEEDPLCAGAHIVVLGSFVEGSGEALRGGRRGGGGFVRGLIGLTPSHHDLKDIGTGWYESRGVL